MPPASPGRWTSCSACSRRCEDEQVEGMAETDSRILEYLEEGLFLYGVGKVQESISRWKKVLELDPKNERALDYIESAGGDVSAYRRSSGVAPAAQPKPPQPQPPPPQPQQPARAAPPPAGATP